MVNLSFARIMYGTNEDIHSMQGMSGPAFASLAANRGPRNSVKATGGSGLATLSKLLHNALAIFTGRS